MSVERYWLHNAQCCLSSRDLRKRRRGISRSLGHIYKLSRRPLAAMLRAFFPAFPTSGTIYSSNNKPDTMSIIRTSDYSQYIFPPSTNTEYRQDVVVTGLIVIRLKAARRIRELKVRFVAEATLAYPGEFYDRQTPEQGRSR